MAAQTQNPYTSASVPSALGPQYNLATQGTPQNLVNQSTNAFSNPATPATAAQGTANTISNTTGNTVQVPTTLSGNWGGNAGNTTASALKTALEQGLTGQAAVDAANAASGGGYAYYADKNVYGIPGGQGYILQNGSGGYDYAPGDAGSASGASGSIGGISGQTLGGGNLPAGSYSALFNTLMGQANQSLNPNNATTQALTDAYNATQQNTERTNLAKVAEKAGGNANISEETRAANEQVGQNTSAFQAQAMQTELAAQRAQIQQALSGAEGLLTADQANALSLQLAQINAAIQQAQIQQDAYQFDTSTGLAAPTGPA